MQDYSQPSNRYTSEKIVIRSSSNFWFPRAPLSRRLVVIEHRFDLRALINVYAWSMARPLWHKEADKSRNRGSMSRHEGCVWCPDADAKTNGTIKLNSSQTPVAVLSLLHSTRFRDSPARSRYNLYTFHWRKFRALRPVSIEFAEFLLTSIRISVSLKLSRAYRLLRKEILYLLSFRKKISPFTIPHKQRHKIKLSQSESRTLN